MSSPFNRTQSKGRRRYLRSNLTKSERLLWRKIRNRNLNGLKFRRQYSVLSYVIDFYCPEYKLAIEIIGDVHGYANRKKSDSVRDRKIESPGIKILTFTNQQIQDEMDGVLQYILSNLPLTPSFIRRGTRDRGQL